MDRHGSEGKVWIKHAIASALYLEKPFKQRELLTDRNDARR